MNDPKDPAHAIADMIDDDSAAPPDSNFFPADLPPAPHPNGEGEPQGEASEIKIDASLDARWRKIDMAVIDQCLDEPQNDTGNGKRLLNHFGSDLLHVREIGWHYWAGTHFEREGGEECVTRGAQRTAARIEVEIERMAATPREQAAIDDGQQATRDLRALMGQLPIKEKEWTDEARKRVETLEYAIAQMKQAKADLSDRKKARKRFAVSSGNASRIRGMIDQALPHKTVTPDALDTDPLAFNCRNGTLHFERVADPECPDPDTVRMIHVANLKPHDQADLITKVAPVDYDPTAECPHFMEFLERFQPSPDIRKFLQTYVGYGLTGLTGEQVLIFCHGLGANGKSTFIEIICRIVGIYSQTLMFESLAEPNFGRRGDQATPDIARLPGARMVRASEPKRNMHLNESMVKSLTGGEPMLARLLNKNFFEFRPIFKLILSGNHKPEITGGDHGIWRRVKLVPWPVTITDADRRPMGEVLAEFWDERSGILNWMVQGALGYLNDGLTTPQEITDATALYREEMDPLNGFVRDCIDKVTPPEGWKLGADVEFDKKMPSVTAREMFEAFISWCEANAVRPWKEKSFGLALPGKGLMKTDERIRRYLWVRLHDVPARTRRSSENPPAPGYSDDEVPL